MGRYSKVIAQNMSDVISGVKTFLVAGGWTLSNQAYNDTYKRTTWTAAKNGVSHCFCVVENGRFPFAVTTGGMYSGSWANEPQQAKDGASYGIYSAAFGMKHGSYGGGEYYMIAPQLLFPCPCYFFETSDQGLLCSFEVNTGRWQHVYAGFFNKSRTGSWTGGWIMSGSTIPARTCNSGTDNGLFLKNGNSNSPCYVPETTLFSYRGYLCGYCNYNGASPSTTWPTGGLGNLQTRPYEWNMIFEGDDGKLINSITSSRLVGLPTLYPLTMTYFKEGRALYGAYLTDLFVCRMDTIAPGEEFMLGTRKYVGVPRYTYDTTQLGVVVRVN